MAAISIGKFQILSTLGSGAHSKILHVRRSADSKQYALKVVPIDKPEDMKYLEQAQYEFRVAQMFDHPNLIKIFALETQTDWLFRVQPFPADSRPADAYATESDCKAALERHMAFLKTANDSYTPGQWRREGNDSVSPYFPTKMITMRNHLECREQR